MNFLMSREKPIMKHYKWLVIGDKCVVVSSIMMKKDQNEM